MTDPITRPCPACQGSGRVSQSPKRGPILTHAQAQVYAYIKSELQGRGRCPSFWEIARALGKKSTSPIHRHITALREMGLLTGTPNGKRQLRLVGDA